MREKLKQIVTVENQILSYQSAVRGELQSFDPINISRGATDIMEKNVCDPYSTVDQKSG